MFNLAGKTALVTGAGRGIGLGIARGLAQQGARVLVNDLFQERAQEASTTLQQEGLDAGPLPFDVTDLDAVRAAFAEAGSVDILVCNAGIPGVEGMKLTQFMDQDPNDWRPQIDLNLYGTLNCVHSALPGMRERGWGRVIVVSSDAGRIGSRAGVSIYGSCKAAAVQFVRVLSQEIAALGITCNAIALGSMDNLPKNLTDRIARGVPTLRLGTPKDAAAAIIYLASEESDWVTGQLLPVNGGLSPA